MRINLMIITCMCILVYTREFQDPPVNINFSFPRPDVPPVNTFFEYITRIQDVAWQSVNDKVLREYQLQFTYINDGNDENTTRSILTDILYNESMYFLPCCLGYGSTMLDLMAEQGITKPLLAPLDITDDLRDVANNPNVVNLLASETEEIATIISYLTVNLQFSRIGYYGVSGNIPDIVNQTLEALGRRLVVYREYTVGVAQNDLLAIVSAVPDAIILTTDIAGTISFIPQLRSFEATNGTILIVPSAQSTTGALNFILSTEENTRGVLAVSSTPTWTEELQPENTIIGMLQQDLQEYDPTLISEAAPFGFVPGTSEIHAYLAIQWLARVIDTIPASNFNSSSIQAAVYQNSLSIIGDQIVGPFIQDCDSVIPCCNQGAHAIYINTLQPVVGGPSLYVQQDSVTWSGCTASPENQPLPLVIGNVGPNTDENIAINSGIRQALDYEQQILTFNGRGALLLQYNTVNANLESLVTELTEVDRALGLIGQTNDLSTVDTGNTSVWSLQPNDTDNSDSVIRLLPTVYDQLFGAMTDIQGEFELVTDDQLLIELAETWSSDLNCKLVQTSNVVIIYNPQYIQIIANRIGDNLYVLGLVEPTPQIGVKYVLSAPPVNSNLQIAQDFSDDGGSSYLQFVGYINGRFFSRVLESITGQLTPTRVADSIYELGVISEGGIATGKISRDNCNKGLRNVYIVGAGIDTITVNWTGCDASPDTTEEFSNKDEDAIAIGTSVGLAAVFTICCFCLILLTVICTTITIVSIATISIVARNNNSIIKLTPPDYYKIAFGADYLLNGETKADSLLKYDHGVEKSDITGYLGLFGQLLLNQPYNRLLISALSQKYTRGKRLAAWLTYFYRHEGHEADLIQLLAVNEVNKITDTDTMFRQDSLLARVFKVYCQMEGLQFLWQRLARIVNEIQLASIGKRKLNIKMTDTVTEEAFDMEMEVDPGKATDRTEADLAVDSYQLRALAQKIFNAVTTEFPNTISKFAQTIIDAVTDRFEDIEPQKLQVIAGSFIFLRYIGPAIAAPHQWGLLEEAPSRSAQRTLILLSKIIQNLSNGRTFEKERYMTSINEFITGNIDNMQDFLHAIITGRIGSTNSSGLTVPISIYNQSIKCLLLASLEHKEHIHIMFSRSLTYPDMIDLEDSYLRPLGLIRE